MIKWRNIHLIEFTAIILLWTLVIISPLLFMDELNQEWRAVYVIWSECIVVGFAFLVNRFILMPKLFFRKRYFGFIIAIFTLLLLLGIFVLYFDGVNIIVSIFNGEQIRSASPPPPMGMPPHGMPPHNMPPVATFIPPTISVIILSIITMALDMGLNIAMKWIVSEQEQSRSENERVSAQLSNLQSWVSPHFFMNTLNNIHALVDIDSQRAKRTIIELSGMMDYLLYESSNEKSVSLQREIEFINSYIQLMRLRFPQQVSITFRYAAVTEDIKIAPLLFLNFIENAFKYGVDYELESFVDIRFSLGENSIEMVAKNSNHSQSVSRTRHGLGIGNARKRLDLLYGQNYSLDICEREDIYSVRLKIPLS